MVLTAHEVAILDAVAAKDRYRFIVVAHNHRSEVQKAGGTLVVSPGEYFGWLLGHCTAVIALLNTLEATIVEL